MIKFKTQHYFAWKQVWKKFKLLLKKKRRNHCIPMDNIVQNIEQIMKSLQHISHRPISLELYKTICLISCLLFANWTFPNSFFFDFRFCFSIRTMFSFVSFSMTQAASFYCLPKEKHIAKKTFIQSKAFAAC